MATEYIMTATVTLGVGKTILAPAASVPDNKVLYVNQLYAERVDTTDVSIIFQDTQATPSILLPTITLNGDKGAVLFEFERIQFPDRTRVFCPVGEGLAVDASVANKAKVWVKYSIGDPLE